VLALTTFSQVLNYLGITEYLPALVPAGGRSVHENCKIVAVNCIKSQRFFDSEIESEINDFVLYQLFPIFPSRL
jgi:hypothetical protein